MNADKSKLDAHREVLVVRFDSGGFEKWQMAVAESCQGLVNRDGPRIYTVRKYDDTPGAVSADSRWIGWLQKAIGFQTKDVHSLAELYADPTVAKTCAKAVAYTDGKPESDIALDNAVTVAGIEDLVVVPAAHASELPGVTVTHSLVGAWDGGKYAAMSRDRAAMAWADDNVRTHAAAGRIAMAQGSTSQFKGMDYYVQNRFFVIYVDASQQATHDTADLQDAILAKYKPITTVYGDWTVEGKDIALLASHGMTRIGAGVNTSFWTHIAIDAQPASQVKGDKPLPYVKGKKYVFLSLTQGDALHFCMKDNLDNLLATVNGQRVAAAYPFGLMHTPRQMEVQPYILAGLQELATRKQTFLAKPYGYSDPQRLLELGVLDDYLRAGKESMRKAGIVDAFINDNELASPVNDVTKMYADVLHPRSIFMKQGESKDGQAPAAITPATHVGDVPVFPDPVVVKTTPDRDANPGTAAAEIDAASDAIVASAKKRDFFWVFLDHTGDASDIAGIIDATTKKDPSIVFLGLDDFVATYDAQYLPNARHDYLQ